MAHAHAAESAGQLLVIVKRHLAQAHGVKHAEHGFTGSDRHRLAVEFDGHVRPRQGLDI